MAANIECQTTSAVLTIRPVRFQSNPQTATSNRFQARRPESDVDAAQELALAEYEALISMLRDAGVEVIEFEDTREPHSPDSIFPNNWISTHADGTVVFYPMEAINRRTERRRDIVERLAHEYGFRIEAVVDLSIAESAGVYLEGTGSLVLDRANRIAYAAISTRTHREPLASFGRRLGYRIVEFHACDADDVAIYHTNVIMCVGASFAVVCLESIADPAIRAIVERNLTESGHEVIAIGFAQVLAFAGNMLQLADRNGGSLIAMSTQAFRSLREPQRAALERHGRLVHAPIDSIEASAGGSVRCMLAELHLERGTASVTDSRVK